LQNKHKIPPSYSRAEESARSLNGCRDDVIFIASEELPELNRGPAISDALKCLRLHAFHGFARPHKYPVIHQQQS
jgi:hypothetical protein